MLELLSPDENSRRNIEHFSTMIDYQTQYHTSLATEETNWIGKRFNEVHLKKTLIDS